MCSTPSKASWVWNQIGAGHTDAIREISHLPNGAFVVRLGGSAPARCLFSPFSYLLTIFDSSSDMRSTTSSTGKFSQSGLSVLDAISCVLVGTKVSSLIAGIRLENAPHRGFNTLFDLLVLISPYQTPPMTDLLT
jgi:hypothetical protein